MAKLRPCLARETRTIRYGGPYETEFSDQLSAGKLRNMWRQHLRVEGIARQAGTSDRRMARSRKPPLSRALKIGDKLVDRSNLSAPTLAIVNTADEVAPLASIKPFTDAMPAKNARIIEYRGEIGVCLQHLGILVEREARMKAWPDIISWLNSRS